MDRPGWLSFRTSLAIAAAILLAGVAFAFLQRRKVRTSLPVTDIRGQSIARWEDEGFVEMVPPIRSPSNVNERDFITVWVKFSREGKVGVRWIGEQKRHVLVYPKGTIADRVTLIEDQDGSGRRRIADVRGTEIGDLGEETFHVWRRNEGHLQGVSWKRGDERQSKEALDYYVDLSSRPGPDRLRPAHLDKLRRTHECAPCHLHARQENRTPVRGQPNRGTDAAGFFQPQTVLENSVPIEVIRPKQRNLDDKFIKFVCRSPSGGESPSKFITRKQDTRWPSCDDGTVPIGVLDVAGALEAKDERVLGICKARRAFYDHMDDEARKVFASAFEVCGIR